MEIEAEEKNGVKDALACDDGARWLCRRRWIYRNREIGGRRWNRRNGANGRRQRRLRCLEWSRTAFISRWLGRRISSWLARKCSTSEKLDRTARSRSTSADLSDKGSGRCKAYTTRKVLAHASDRVNPDAFGIGSGQGRRAAPFQCGAGGY